MPTNQTNDLGEPHNLGSGITIFPVVFVRAHFPLVNAAYEAICDLHPSHSTIGSCSIDVNNVHTQLSKRSTNPYEQSKSKEL